MTYRDAGVNLDAAQDIWVETLRMLATQGRQAAQDDRGEAHCSR